MLLDVDYEKVGNLIEEILDLIKPIPDGVSEEEREKLDEWRQMYAMSSHFGEWKVSSLEKFVAYIKKQQKEGKEVDYLCFGSGEVDYKN